jgi:hypothetical protein
MTSWELVNPEGGARPSTVTPARRPASLKTVGLAWNGKPGGEDALCEIARLLAESDNGVQFVKYWEAVPDSVSPRELSQSTIRRMAAHQPDLVIVAQAD